MVQTTKKHRFAELVLGSSRSHAECYRIAYPHFKGSAATAANNAYRLMQDDDVKAVIERGRDAIIARIAENQANLRETWESAILADRNELAELRIIPCRYCHGIGHRYQETPAEHEERRRQYDETSERLSENPKAWARMKPFDELGGVGYTIHRLPHPDCPECHSLGEERVVLKDTRDLSPEARMIYEGMDVKNGVPVVKVRSRSDVDDKLAKHLRMYRPEAPPADGAIAADEPVRMIAVYPSKPHE